MKLLASSVLCQFCSIDYIIMVNFVESILQKNIKYTNELKHLSRLSVKTALYKFSLIVTIEHHVANLSLLPTKYGS